jgi:hypothetical protein
MITTTSSLFVTYWAIRMANKRGDEALLGVLRGVPISTRTRWMILTTHYTGLAAFIVAFLTVTTFVLRELARNADEPAVATIGYMAVVLWGGSAVYCLATAAAWVYHASTVIRRAEGK